MSNFRSKTDRNRLSKSIKINKICDVMCWTCCWDEKIKGNNSSVPCQNQVKLFREEVYGHSQLPVLKN